MPHLTPNSQQGELTYENIYLPAGNGCNAQFGFVFVGADDVAVVQMTLTAPGCPAAQSLPVEVAEKVKAAPGVADAKVDVVWEPAWTKDRMSDAAKLQLGMW